MTILAAGEAATAIGGAAEGAGIAEGAGAGAGAAGRAAAKGPSREEYRQLRREVANQRRARERQQVGPAAKKAAGQLAAREPRPQAPQSSRGRKTGERVKGRLKSSAKQGISIPKFPGTGSGSAHKIVIAEFIACVVLLGVTPLLMRDPKSGKLYMPNDFVRLTAVSLVFFVLALMSNSPLSSRFAAAFGGLVTLGVLFNSTQTLTAIDNIFVNQQAVGTGVQAAAAGAQSVVSPSYQTTGLIGQAVTAIGQGAQAVGQGIAAEGIGASGTTPSTPATNKQGLT